MPSRNTIRQGVDDSYYYPFETILGSGMEKGANETWDRLEELTGSPE